MSTEPEALNVEWTDSVETLIKQQGEKALSYAWLHTRAEKRYFSFSTYLAIPSIILSGVTGVLSGTFAGSQDVAYATAILAIFIGVLGTLNSYFGFAKRAEGHRITSVNYSKLYLQISIELSIPRSKRMIVKDFLKTVAEQVQRLNEIQPQIPDIVILDYQEKFKDEPNTISRPEIIKGLASINVYNEPEVIPEKKLEACQSFVAIPDPEMKPKSNPIPPWK